MTPTEATTTKDYIDTASTGQIAIALLELQKGLLERCDRYEKALWEIASGEYHAEPRKIAQEALTQ